MNYCHLSSQRIARQRKQRVRPLMLRHIISLHVKQRKRASCFSRTRITSFRLSREPRLLSSVILPRNRDIRALDPHLWIRRRSRKQSLIWSVSMISWWFPTSRGMWETVRRRWIFCVRQKRLPKARMWCFSLEDWMRSANRKDWIVHTWWCRMRRECSLMNFRRWMRTLSWYYLQDRRSRCLGTSM